MSNPDAEDDAYVQGIEESLMSIIEFYIQVKLRIKKESGVDVVTGWANYFYKKHNGATK